MEHTNRRLNRVARRSGLSFRFAETIPLKHMLRPGRILLLGTALIVLLIFLQSRQESGGEDNQEAVSVVEAFAWDTPVSEGSTGVLSKLRPDDVRRHSVS